MKSDAQVDAAAAPPYVSTGHLPPPERVRELVAAAYERFKSNEDGKNADVYPALAAVPADLFGVCVVATSGDIYAIGDSDYEFLDHERVQAVRVRAGLSVRGRGECPRAARGQRDRTAVQLVGGDRAGRRRQDQSDGEFRSHRHDQPGSGFDARCEVAVHPGRLVALCRPRTLNQRGRIRFRRKDQSSQPGDCPAPADALVGSTSIRPRRPISIRGNARST